MFVQLVLVAILTAFEPQALKLFSFAMPDPAEVTKAAAARKAFATWHGYSLLANFATLLFVTIAIALAAQLPPLPATEVVAERKEV